MIVSLKNHLISTLADSPLAQVQLAGYAALLEDGWLEKNGCLSNLGSIFFSISNLSASQDASELAGNLPRAPMLQRLQALTPSSAGDQNEAVCTMSLLVEGARPEVARFIAGVGTFRSYDASRTASIATANRLDAPFTLTCLFERCDYLPTTDDGATNTGSIEATRTAILGWSAVSAKLKAGTRCQAAMTGALLITDAAMGALHQTLCLPLSTPGAAGELELQFSIMGLIISVITASPVGASSELQTVANSPSNVQLAWDWVASWISPALLEDAALKSATLAAVATSRGTGTAAAVLKVLQEASWIVMHPNSGLPLVEQRGLHKFWPLRDNSVGVIALCTLSEHASLTKFHWTVGALETEAAAHSAQITFSPMMVLGGGKIATRSGLLLMGVAPPTAAAALVQSMNAIQQSGKSRFKMMVATDVTEWSKQHGCTPPLAGGEMANAVRDALAAAIRAGVLSFRTLRAGGGLLAEFNQNAEELEIYSPLRYSGTSKPTVFVLVRTSSRGERGGTRNTLPLQAACAIVGWPRRGAVQQCIFDFD